MHLTSPHLRFLLVTALLSSDIVLAHGHADDDHAAGAALARREQHRHRATRLEKVRMRRADDAGVDQRDNFNPFGGNFLGGPSTDLFGFQGSTSTSTSSSSTPTSSHSSSHSSTHHHSSSSSSSHPSSDPDSNSGSQRPSASPKPASSVSSTWSPTTSTHSSSPTQPSWPSGSPPSFSWPGFGGSDSSSSADSSTPTSWPGFSLPGLSWPSGPFDPFHPSSSDDGPSSASPTSKPGHSHGHHGHGHSHSGHSTASPSGGGGLLSIPLFGSPSSSSDSRSSPTGSPTSSSSNGGGGLLSIPLFGSSSSSSDGQSSPTATSSSSSSSNGGGGLLSIPLFGSSSSSSDGQSSPTATSSSSSSSNGGGGLLSIPLFGSSSSSSDGQSSPTATSSSSSSSNGGGGLLSIPLFGSSSSSTTSQPTGSSIPFIPFGNTTTSAPTSQPTDGTTATGSSTGSGGSSTSLSSGSNSSSGGASSTASGSLTSGASSSGPTGSAGTAAPTKSTASPTTSDPWAGFVNPTSLVLGMPASSSSSGASFASSSSSASSSSASGQSSTTPQLPSRIVPPTGPVVNPPADSSLVSLLFQKSLNWQLLVDNSDTTSQVFAYMPSIIAAALNLTSDQASQVINSALQAYNPQGTSLTDPSQMLSLYQAYIPTSDVNALELQIKSPGSSFYTASNNVVAKQLAKLVDPSYPIAADTSAGNRAAAGGPGSNGSGNEAHKLRNALIGLGCAVAAAIIAFIAWRLYRRKQKAAEADQGRGADYVASNDLPGGPYRDEPWDGRQARGGAQQMAEVDLGHSADPFADPNAHAHAHHAVGIARGSGVDWDADGNSLNSMTESQRIRAEYLHSTYSISSSNGGGAVGGYQDHRTGGHAQAALHSPGLRATYYSAHSEGEGSSEGHGSHGGHGGSISGGLSPTSAQHGRQSTTKRGNIQRSAIGAPHLRENSLMIQ